MKSSEITLESSEIALQSSEITLELSEITLELSEITLKSTEITLIQPILTCDDSGLPIVLTQICSTCNNVPPHPVIHDSIHVNSHAVLSQDLTNNRLFHH